MPNPETMNYPWLLQHIRISYLIQVCCLRLFIPSTIPIDCGSCINKANFCLPRRLIRLQVFGKES